MALSGGLFVKLDPKFPFNHKSVQVGPFGRLMYISGLCYCVESLSDGFIPSRVTSRIADVDDPDPCASVRALVAAKMWSETNGGYVVHDYHDWQSVASEVKRKRQQNKRRQQQYRKRVTSASRDEAGNAGVTHPETEKRQRQRQRRINSSFVAPTLEAVQAHCLERKSSIDPETFVAHYAANGWVQSNGRPIKDWQACIVTWEKRQAATTPKKSRVFDPKTQTYNPHAED